MKTIKINFVFLFLLTLISCNKFDIVDQYPLGDSIYLPSAFYHELSKTIINQKLEGYDLNVDPGIHGDLAVQMDTVSIHLPGIFSSETDPKRVFAYYIPKNISDNYRIMFEFHGNFETSDAATYGYSTSIGDMWKTVAEENNTVIIQPIGTIRSGQYGWIAENGDQYLVDILVELFKKQLKEKKGLNLDVKSIYSTGTSSGGIFSFQLAIIRSNLMAAVVPRYGSVSFKNYMASMINYRVPMRVYTGSLDQRVSPKGVIENATNLAVNGYQITQTPSIDSLQYEWYPIKNRADSTKVWRTVYNDNTGGLVEIYLLEKAAHSQLYAPQMCPEIMKFMVEHSKK